MADSYSVRVKGKAALRGVPVGMVRGEQGPSCVGEGVVDLDAHMREADAGFL